MGIFDEKPIPNSFEEKAEIERIEFSSVEIIPGNDDWSAEIIIDVFDSKGETPEGIMVGIFYKGKRISAGTSDEWGNAVIKVQNLPLPNPREEKVKLQARVKGHAVTAYSESFVIGKTKSELDAERFENERRENERREKERLEKERLEKERLKKERKAPYNILLLNNDITKMDFVVSILKVFFNKSEIEAERIMMEVHENGHSICATLGKEEAELIVEKITDFCEAKSDPLECIALPAHESP